METTELRWYQDGAEAYHATHGNLRVDLYWIPDDGWGCMVSVDGEELWSEPVACGTDRLDVAAAKGEAANVLQAELEHAG